MGARLPMVALLALTLMVFAPILMPGTVLYYRDVSQNHLPVRQLTMDVIGAGEAPLWNPLRGAGQPLLANPNALVLHPTTALFFILPLHAAMKASLVLQILLAAIATWLLLRDIGAGTWARLIGAAAFAFSGPMLSLGNLFNLLDSAAFMPLTLWLAGRAVTRRFAPWGPLAALSLSVQLLAGEPALLLCTALAFLALHWSYPAPPQARRRSLTVRSMSLAGILLLALAVSMVGVIPTLELLARSERGEGFGQEEALKWSLHPAALVETFIPWLFGDPTRTSLREFWGGGVNDAGLPLLLSLWIGPGVLILAACGLILNLTRRGPPRAEAIALGLLALVATVLAVGRHLPLYPALLDLAPSFAAARYPVKYFLLAVWAVAVLAARGYGALCARSIDRESRTAPLALLLGGLLVIVATRWGFARGALERWLAGSLPLAPEDLAAMNASLDRSALYAAIMLALSGLFVVYPIPGRARLARWGVLAALAGMHIAVVAGINPVTSADFYAGRPLLADALGEGAGRLWAQPRPPGFAYRTPAGVRGGSLEAGFRWDRDSLRNATYFPLGIRFAFDRGNERLDVMPGAAAGRELAQSARDPAATDGALRLLSLAGVDRIITYGGLQHAGVAEIRRLEGSSNIPLVVLANRGALPRAYIVAAHEVVAGDAAALKRVREPAFDPTRTIVIDDDYGHHLPARGIAPEPAGEARIVEERSRMVRIECRADRPAWLVLLDTHYPGWEATVDGAAAPIARANAMFRAVPIQAGEHMVELRYRPDSVRSGTIISCLALVLCGLMALRRGA